MDLHVVVDGMFWFLAFLFSTTVHEACHAYVALLGGDKTAYRGGQVSLNPIPHIRREPIGMLVVPLLTAFTQGWAMGWASAPFDPLWADRHPRRAAWMAAAGPAGNFLLAVISWIALRIGLATNFFMMPNRAGYGSLVMAAGDLPGKLAPFLAQGLSIMLMLNVLLGVFNLLPLPPMDGSAAAELLLPAATARKFRLAVRNPVFSLVGLLIAWQGFPYIASPLFGLVLKSLYPSVTFR